MGNLFSTQEEVVEETPFKTWITDSIHALGDKRLNQLVLPGSHNSATYCFTRASRYSVDQPGLVKYRPPWPVSSVIASWSRTQLRSLVEQLSDGIRYFDIRVGHQRGEFYSCHGMNGDTISNILSLFVEHAESFPQEVIILDFNHFYNMSHDDHETLTKEIQEVVGSKLWPFHHADVTLNEAHNLNIGPIVIIYHKPEGHKHSFFPNSAITAPWHNTDNMELLRERLQQSLLQFDRQSKQLFVSQFILTPKLDTIIGGWWRWNKPWTLFGLARRLNEEIVEWIAKFHEDRPLNIVLLDHYHTHNLIDLIVKLNFTSHE